MNFVDLRSFIKYLESKGELVRIKVPVDPNQEINIIQHRVMSYGGPALLFETVNGSPYRVVTNLFGSKKRVDLIFGGCPSEFGEKIVKMFYCLMPLSVKSILKHRKDLFSLLKIRMRVVKTGPIKYDVFDEPDLMKLPVLTSWPKDGGPFFTLPIVHTIDPETGIGNIGIYRLQRFNHNTTGMHWQIEKGGMFHFSKAMKLNKTLPVSVILGGPPSLIISAIAPLPENIDERLLASYIMRNPLDVVISSVTGHKIPAMAEFVIEGTVSDGDMRDEGPFGDHLGHYSIISKFPVFRVKRLFARKNAIYPATVVGKPIQEDFYIGAALQEMVLPLLKMIRPVVYDFWAYPETGFHPLAVMSVDERYPNEALKSALGILGDGQMSLTKVLIVVSSNVNVRKIYDVSEALWKYLNFNDGFHLISPTTQDTLDFTGSEINVGSRLIILAVDRSNGCLRNDRPKFLLDSCNIDFNIIGICAIGPAFLIIKIKSTCCDIEGIRNVLYNNEVTNKYLFHVLVSEDVNLNDVTMILWGWFTRFDPFRDLYPFKRSIVHNKLVFEFPIIIDARWKNEYPDPVEFDPDIKKKIYSKWGDFGLC